MWCKVKFKSKSVEVSYFPFILVSSSLCQLYELEGRGNSIQNSMEGMRELYSVIMCEVGIMCDVYHF